MQVVVSPSNAWVVIFILLMQVGVSVVTMQLVPSAAHNCFYHKMLVIVSVVAMYVTLSCNNFIFLSLTDTHVS